MHSDGLARPKNEMVIHDPKVFKFKLADLGNFFSAKKGEELPQFCVWKHGYRSKFTFTHVNTHTTMATPLPFSVDNAIVPTCAIAIWVMFLFFSGS